MQKYLIQNPPKATIKPKTDQNTLQNKSISLILNVDGPSWSLSLEFSLPIYYIVPGKWRMSYRSATLIASTSWPLLSLARRYVLSKTPISVTCFFFPCPFSLFDLLLVFFSVSNAAICFLFSNFSFGICSCNQSFEGCRSLGFVSDLGFCYEWTSRNLMLFNFGIVCHLVVSFYFLSFRLPDDFGNLKFAVWFTACTNWRSNFIVLPLI